MLAFLICSILLLSWVAITGGWKFTMSILKLHARDIFDSCGNPTVEVDLCTTKGLFMLLCPVVPQLVSMRL